MNTYLLKYLKIKMPWLVGSGGGVGLGTGQGMELLWIEEKESFNFVRKVLFLKS